MNKNINNKKKRKGNDMFGLGSLYHLGRSAIAAIKGDEDEMLNELHEAEQSLTHPFDRFGG